MVAESPRAHPQSHTYMYVHAQSHTHMLLLKSGCRLKVAPPTGRMKLICSCGWNKALSFSLIAELITVGHFGCTLNDCFYSLFSSSLRVLVGMTEISRLRLDPVPFAPSSLSLSRIFEQHSYLPVPSCPVQCGSHLS